MADEPEKPEEKKEPEATDEDAAELAAGLEALSSGRYFKNIEAFVGIRIEAYMMQGAILEVQFGGAVDDARRAFMGRAMEVFDTVARTYRERSFDINMRNIRRRRAAREKEREKPPEPDPSAAG